VSAAELTTAGTDAVLAFTAVVLAAKLRRLPSGACGFYFVGALASTGVAAGAGALFHGLREVAPPLVPWLLWRFVPLGIAAPPLVPWLLWRFVPLGIAGTSAGLLLGAVRAHAAGRTGQAIGALAWTKLVAVTAASLTTDGLLVVGLDLATTLALLLGIETVAYLRGHAGAAFILAGTGATLTALLIQVSGFRHGAPWNHNDSFHLLQAVAISLFFAGASRAGLHRASAAMPAETSRAPVSRPEVAPAEP
jgi:hypothetical protein